MTDLQAIYNQANEAYNSERYAEAIPLYDQILKAKPELAAQINLNRGACFFQDGQNEEAIIAFDAALTADPTLAGAHLNKGKVLEKSERWAEAAESYSAAYELDNSFKVLGDLSHCYNQDKQHEQALQTAALGLEKEPDQYMKLRNERIFAFFKLGKPMESVEEVTEILKQNELGSLRPEQIELYSNVLTQKANNLQEDNKFDEAITYLEMVDNGNRSPDSQYQLGLCYLRAGEEGKAVPYLENAVEGNGNNWKYRVGLGTAYMRPGVAEFEKAAEHLGKALEFPEARQEAESSISFNYALALMRTGRDDEAKAPLETVYEKDKSNWIAAALLGTVYVSPSQEMYAEAIPVLIHAIDTSNGAADDSVYYNLGYAYLMLGRFKDAADAFRQALEKNPNNEMAKNALERAEQAVKEEEEAKRAAEEAARLEAERQAEAERRAAELAAAEKAAKDAEAKRKAHEEKERYEREQRELKEEAERQRQLKIAEERKRREKRIKDMQVRLGPDRERLRRPSLDLIPTGNTAKNAFGYADWYNKTQANEYQFK